MPLRIPKTLSAFLLAAPLLVLGPALLEEAAAQSRETGATAPPAKTDLARSAEKSIGRGLAFLRSRQDKASGAWLMQGEPEAGITALALTAFLRAPRDEGGGADMSKTVAWIASLAKEDGSIFAGELANYVTSAAVLALEETDDPRFAPIIAKAQKYLVRCQCDEAEGFTPDNKLYGGAGYGGADRPDLSNLAFAMDALHASGLPKESDAYRKALVFLNRCQNSSETNKDEWKDPDTGEVFVSGNDGGGIYMPASSKAGVVTLPDGKKIPRSYGSMTYALLKCYLIAGLPKDDPRVKAAMGWIRKNFTLDENPGFDVSADPEAAQQGLYYYYFMMAKALDLYGERTFVDGSGRERHWARELADKLVAIQRADGSWINEKTRWWENVPELATSYAVLALTHCRAHL